MGALPKSDTAVAGAPAPSGPQKVALDRYGRDPSSPGEVLRRLTNYNAQSGYAPFYAAWLADLPRLSSGHVFDMFIMSLCVMSLGRPDNPARGRRHEWTKAITLEDLASIIRCHLRDVQRNVKDCQDRKIIAARCKGRGLYEFSLLYRDWQALPDYQPGPKVCAIDEPEESSDETPEDVEVVKGAVRLVKRPLKVEAGRMGRSIKVDVGVRSLRWQNAASLPLVYDAVVQSGELIVSTRLAAAVVLGVTSEDQANVSRHLRRDGDGPPADSPPVHERAGEVVAVFDPLLEKSGGRLLIGDARALLEASKAMGQMPKDYLVYWLHAAGNSPRGARPISGPKVVASIVREAFQNWRKTAGKVAVRPAGASSSPRAKSGGRPSFAESVRAKAERRFKKYGRL